MSDEGLKAFFGSKMIRRSLFALDISRCGLITDEGLEMVKDTAVEGTGGLRATECGEVCS